MLAWSGEWNWYGRRETRNCGYDVIVGGELFTDYPDHSSQTCHAKPKTQINRLPDATSFFLLVGCLPQAAGLKDFSPKVRTLWHCRLRSVALYLWLIGDIRVSKSTVAAISGLHCRALVISSEHKADSLIAKFKEAANGHRDWWRAESPRLSPLWLSASSSACHGLLIITVIMYYLQSPWQNAENWSWRTRQLPTCRCVSVMLLRSMQNTRRS